MAEEGTLVVIVLKAKDLPDKHTFSKQDPFAQLTLGDSVFRSKINQRGGQHPLWDEEFRVPVSKTDRKRTLEISCWATEPRGDEILGTGKVDITDTLKTGEFDDWVLLSNNGVQRGEVYMEMTFYASGPAPLQRRATKMKPAERLSRPNMPAANGVPPMTPPKSPTQAAYLTPNRTSPHTSDKPLPRPGEGGAFPPLLRPGNLASPGQPLPHTSPLAPNDPLHPTASDSLPDPWSSNPGPASPPLGASAYPPAPGANKSSSPSLPSSLLPAGGAPRPNYTQHGRHSSAELRAHSPFVMPGSTPPSAPYAQSSYGRSAERVGTPAFPGSVGSSPYPPYAQPPGGDRALSPAFPSIDVSAPYGAPGGNSSYYPDPASQAPPSFPMAMPSTDTGPSSSYGSYGSAPQQSAAPYSSYREPTPAPAPYGGGPAYPSHPGAFRHESQVATPRAEFQPQYQPVQAVSHLRQPSPPRTTPAPVGGTSEYSAYSGAYQPGWANNNNARADADAARDFQRREQEQERVRLEQEERDLALARQLDRELNAPGVGSQSGSGGTPPVSGGWSMPQA